MAPRREPMACTLRVGDSIIVGGFLLLPTWRSVVRSIELPLIVQCKKMSKNASLVLWVDWHSRLASIKYAGPYNDNI